jgi:pimeloyl-ACP methyl ester carboxylesterase
LETFVSVQGYPIHALDSGAGPPVLLLHGFAGDAEEWRPTLQFLAGQGYRAIAVDALGFGRSDKPGDAPYSLKLYADLYAGLLDILGLEQATLVGHSLGGKLALATSLLHPDRVKRLILVDSDGFIVPSPLTQAGAWPLLGPALLRLSAQPFSVRALLTTAFAHPETHVTPERVNRFSAALGAPDNRRVLRAISRRYDATDLRRTGLRSRLKELRCPTLLIWGAADRVFAPKYGAIAQREIPGARLVTIPDCGHFPHIEAPRAFRGLLVGFLAGGRFKG